MAAEVLDGLAHRVLNGRCAWTQAPEGTHDYCDIARIQLLAPLIGPGLRLGAVVGVNEPTNVGQVLARVVEVDDVHRTGEALGGEVPDPWGAIPEHHHLCGPAELKEDFGAGGFCLQSFYGTEAVFRLICCLYNLMAEFRRDFLHAPTQRLLTLRHELFVIGGILGAHGRTPVLRLGLRAHWREKFAALLSRIGAYTIPTVAQFDFHALTQQLGPPRHWKPRRRPPLPSASNLVPLLTY